MIQPQVRFQPGFDEPVSSAVSMMSATSLGCLPARRRRSPRFPPLRRPGRVLTDLIRLRTREGMKVAKAKGRLRGKQPKLNHRQEAHLVALFDGGDPSTAKLADLFGVTRSTVYRAVERDRVGAGLGAGMSAG